MGLYGAPPDLPEDQRLEVGGALVFDTEANRSDRRRRFPHPAPAVEADDRSPWWSRGSAPSPRWFGDSRDLRNAQPHSRDGMDPTRSPRAAPTRCGSASMPGRAVPARIPDPVGTEHLLLAPRVAAAAWCASPYPPRTFLTLPIRPERENEPGISFGAPAGAAPMRTESLRTPENRWTVTRDVGSDTHEVTIVKGNGAERFPDITLDAAHRAVERYTWTGNDVASVRAQTTWTEVFERGDWSARTVTHTDVSCTESNFLLRAHLEAFDGEELLRRYEWQEEIPRRLV